MLAGPQMQSAFPIRVEVEIVQPTQVSPFLAGNSPAVLGEEENEEEEATGNKDRLHTGIQPLCLFAHRYLFQDPVIFFGIG